MAGNREPDRATNGAAVVDQIVPAAAAAAVAPVGRSGQGSGIPGQLTGAEEKGQGNVETHEAVEPHDAVETSESHGWPPGRPTVRNGR